MRDTGVGIDESELPHIFDRFYRGTMANEARGSGSGLGLAIVKSIVDLHNGPGRRRQPARRRHDVHGQPAEGPARRQRGQPATPERIRSPNCAQMDSDPAGSSGFFTIRRLLTESRSATLAMTCRSSVMPGAHLDP